MCHYTPESIFEVTEFLLSIFLIFKKHFHPFFPYESDSCTDQIYEIGGGSGTCAKCILDYMMLNAPPKVYNDMKYM